jgi:hypothetical protein
MFLYRWTACYGCVDYLADRPGVLYHEYLWEEIVKH